MNILFLVPYPKQGASNRFRVEQFLPYLAEQKISFAVHSFWGESAFRVLYKKGNILRKTFYFIMGTAKRLIDILFFWKYDIVFVHREAFPLFNPGIESLFTFLKKPLIFDFDDAIFLPSMSGSNNFIERLKRPEKIAAIIAMSDFVIAGNSYLEGFARRFNQDTAVIPTSIDTDLYRPRKQQEKNPLVIGWIGSVTTSDFLATLEPVFIRILEKFDNVIFKIVGGRADVENLPSVIVKPWVLDEEIGDLKTFDIGIMPMPDNDWTKGKCGFKAILYMAVGIPCVASPVGMNKEIIIDGLNGFLAVTESEWVEKLSSLIVSRELRERLGAAGRSTIESGYSLKANAPRFLSVIREVYQKNRKA